MRARATKLTERRKRSEYSKNARLPGVFAV